MGPTNSLQRFIPANQDSRPKSPLKRSRTVKRSFLVVARVAFVLVFVALNVHYYFVHHNIHVEVSEDSSPPDLPEEEQRTQPSTSSLLQEEQRMQASTLSVWHVGSNHGSTETEEDSNADGKPNHELIAETREGKHVEDAAAKTEAGGWKAMPALNNSSSQPSDKLFLRHEASNHSRRDYQKKNVKTTPKKREQVTDRTKPIYNVSMARDAIQPEWICGTKTTGQARFAFVHIFKTAGSTMRTFFAQYSKLCGKGWMVLSSCTNADVKSIQSRGSWKPCTLSLLLQRNGNLFKIKKSSRVNNNMIEQNVDIFGGHFKLGSGDWLQTSNNTLNKVRHITFLRDPKAKYVSGVLYVKKDLSFSAAVKKIKHDVTRAREKGEYRMRIGDYLLTPLQKEENKKQKKKLSVEQKANLVMKNLVDYNVIVGMVEHMSDSMEILQYIFDYRKRLTPLFTHYGSKKSYKVNQSRLSTSKVLTELRKDKTFFKSFTEYVKYEQLITDFAMDMHQQQLAATRRGSEHSLGSRVA